VDPDPDPAVNPKDGGPNRFSLVEAKKFVDAPESAMMQVLYDVGLTDFFDCINYGLVLYIDANHTIGNLTELELGQALLSLGLIVHKSPSVFYQCYKVYVDGRDFAKEFGYSFKWSSFLTQVATNLLLNFIDIYLEAHQGVDAL
jgi:hypothetical protein